MKKNSKKLAVAKLPDPIRSVCKSIMPPPSKADVLKATAKAIYDERLAEYQEVQAQSEAESKALMDHITKQIKVPGVVANIWSDNAYCAERKGNRRCINLTFYLTPELEKRIESIPARGCAPRLENIESELRSRANDRTAIVGALLADPDVKAKLIKMGESILNKISPSEKAASINV